MATFEKAEIIKDPAGDYILIPEGVRVFIDTDKAKFEQGLEEFTRFFARDAALEMIDSGRGQIMVAVPAGAEVRVPVAFAGDHTGYFWILPDGVSLNDAAVQLYGADHAAPVGFWEWFATNHPEAFRRTLDMAEGVKEVAKEIKGSMTWLYVAGGIVGGILLLNIISNVTRGRR